MKIYLSVLPQNTIDVNTIFRNKLIFFGNLKNLKTEFYFPHNHSYLHKILNNLMRYFVVLQPFFYFPSFQQFIYLKKMELKIDEELTIPSNGNFRKLLLLT